MKLCLLALLAACFTSSPVARATPVSNRDVPAVFDRERTPMFTMPGNVTVLREHAPGDDRWVVQIRFDQQSEKLRQALKELGEPTGGACWQMCWWGEYARLTVTNTRVENYTTLELR